jgi:hypothetical protein
LAVSKTFPALLVDFSSLFNPLATIAVSVLTLVGCCKCTKELLVSMLWAGTTLYLVLISQVYSGLSIIVAAFLNFLSAFILSIFAIEVILTF